MRDDVAGLNSGRIGHQCSRPTHRMRGSVIAETPRPIDCARDRPMLPDGAAVYTTASEPATAGLEDLNGRDDGLALAGGEA